MIPINKIIKRPDFYIAVAIILASILMQFCSTKQELTKKEIVSPPIPSAQKPFQSFKINIEKGAHIKLTDGTEITIAPNSLLTMNGEKAKGNVYLLFRSYHSSEDIFLSGIPMDYIKSGIKNHLQSAGMYEIKARQKGAELQIADDNCVSVKLPSWKSGNDFNFWWLDEKNGSWEYIDRRDAVENKEKIELIKEIDKLKPEIKFPLEKTYFVLNYNAILDIFYNDNYADIYKNAQKHTINSKAQQYGLEWTAVYCGDYVEYKGVSQKASMLVWKNTDNKTMPKWLTNDEIYNYAEFVKLKANTFRITVKNDKNMFFSCIVEAIMPLKSLFAYSPEYWIKNYDLAMQKVDEQMQKLKLEADVYRTFEINQFGIYNYDKFIKEENKVMVIADFKKQFAQPETNANDDIVYCLPEEIKTVIKYPKKDWDKVSLLTGTRCRFLTVNQDLSIAVYTAEQYQKINFDSLKKVGKPAYNFKLASANNIKIQSEKDLLLALGIK